MGRSVYTDLYIYLQMNSFFLIYQKNKKAYVRTLQSLVEA